MAAVPPQAATSLFASQGAGGGGQQQLGTAGQAGSAIAALSAFLPQIQQKTIGLALSPEQQAQVNQAIQGLLAQTAQFQQGIQPLAGQVTTQLPLQTGFARPQFGQALDPAAQRLAAQGTQQLQQQAGARQAQAAQRFQGQPGVANVLGQQAALTAGLQANPLLLQAAQEQRAREAQEFALAQQAQQLSNQALLAQAQFQNQALGTQAGLLGLGQTSQQNLLAALAQALAATGQRETRAESPGIFGRIGALFK